eukprot:8103442-Karenia_brevis.AAC.1
MEDSEGEEIQMDLPPSPIEEQEGVGPPWPSSVDNSFLVLPGKGNVQEGKGFCPQGLQYAANM